LLHNTAFTACCCLLTAAAACFCCSAMCQSESESHCCLVVHTDTHWCTHAVHLHAPALASYWHGSARPAMAVDVHSASHLSILHAHSRNMNSAFHLRFHFIYVFLLFFFHLSSFFDPLCVSPILVALPLLPRLLPLLPLWRQQQHLPLPRRRPLQLAFLHPFASLLPALVPLHET